MENRTGIDGFFLSIQSAKDLKALFSIYQLMLNNLRNFPAFYLVKVRRFVNSLYLPTLLWTDEEREIVNNDPGNILRFKTLLCDLFDHTLSRDKSYLNKSG